MRGVFGRGGCVLGGGGERRVKKRQSPAFRSPEVGMYAFQSITAIEESLISCSIKVGDIFPVGSHSAFYASIQA